jgi:hypothetical protein
LSIFEVDYMVWLKILLFGNLGINLATFLAHLRKPWWISAKKNLATLVLDENSLK